MAHLHADLVSVSDEHHRGAIGITGVGVDDDAGIAAELVDRPALRHEFFEIGFEDAVAHRRLETDRAGRGEDVAHELELAGARASGWPKVSIWKRIF